MPDEKQQPNPQPSQPGSPADVPQIIQPMNSGTISLPSPSQELSPVVFPTVAQPQAMVNGQPFRPTTPTPSGQFEQMPTGKSWSWLYLFIVLSILSPIGALVFLAYMIIKKQWDRFFIALGTLQVAGAALFFLIMFELGGVAGGEFVALALFATLVPIVGLVALANLIGLPIYMRKRKPQGKGRVLGIVSLVISLLLALYSAYSVC